MTAIFKRECKAYFTSLITYFFLAAFFIAEGVLFYVLYQNGSTATYAIPFSYPLYCAIFLIPLLTMRTISEDNRQKVDQVLLTAPVSVTDIVLGKFFACFSIYALAYAPTLIFQLIVSYHSTVNWALYLYSIFGTMLLGSVLIAMGIFISSLTESTALAAVLTIVTNLVLMFISSIAELAKVEWLTDAAEHIALLDRYANFGESVLNVADIVFFLSITVFCLFLCVRSVERRRWA